MGVESSLGGALSADALRRLVAHYHDHAVPVFVTRPAATNMLANSCGQEELPPDELVSRFEVEGM